MLPAIQYKYKYQQLHPDHVACNTAQVQKSAAASGSCCLQYSTVQVQISAAASGSFCLQYSTSTKISSCIQITLPAIQHKYKNQQLHLDHVACNTVQVQISAAASRSFCLQYSSSTNISSCIRITLPAIQYKYKKSAAASGSCCQYKFTECQNRLNWFQFSQQINLFSLFLSKYDCE